MLPVRGRMGGSAPYNRRDMSVRDERWDLDLLRRAERYQQWILASFGAPLAGRVLEVGAGTGNFTRWIARSAAAVTALEPDADNAAAVRGLGLDGVEVLEQPVEALAGNGHGRRYDAVTMINVLEHIADDAAAVRVAAGLLEAGGRLCILVPAHEALMSRLDRAYGHVRRYSKARVETLLAQAGLAVRECRYFNPLGAIGWLLFVRLPRRRHLSPGAVTLTERLVVPAGRALDRTVEAPFGQSVLAVAERRL